MLQCAGRMMTLLRLLAAAAAPIAGSRSCWNGVAVAQNFRDSVLQNFAPSGTNRERGPVPDRPKFDSRRYNPCKASPARGAGANLSACDARLLKKLKTAMGGSCKNLAWIRARRRILLGSAPKPSVNRRRFCFLPGNQPRAMGHGLYEGLALPKQTIRVTIRMYDGINLLRT